MIFSTNLAVKNLRRTLASLNDQSSGIFQVIAEGWRKLLKKMVIVRWVLFCRRVFHPSVPWTIHLHLQLHRVVWYEAPMNPINMDPRLESGGNILDAPYVRSRELFISDAIDTYPVTALRGRACCLPFSDIKTNILEYISKPNNWFYILGYKPESWRMANAKGKLHNSYQPQLRSVGEHRPTLVVHH